MRIDFDIPLTSCIACESPSIQDWLNQTTHLGVFRISRCNSCGAAFLNPQPTLDFLQQHVYPASGQGLTERALSIESALSAGVAYGPAIRRFIKESIRLLDESGGSKPYSMLDIGAGFGFYSREAERQGCRVLAVNPRGGENSIFRELNPSIPLVEDLFELADLGSTCFDLIIANHVLEHVRAPREFLLKAVAHLRTPNGILALAVPNLKWLLTGFIKKRSEGVFHIPEHLVFFTEGGLRSSLRSVGMDVIKAKNSTYIPFRSIARRLGLRGDRMLDWYYTSVWYAQRLADRLLSMTGRGLVLLFWATKE